MRKNLLEVWAAFRAYKEHTRHKSVSARKGGRSGWAVYSYTTPILVESIGWMDGGRWAGTRWEVWTLGRSPVSGGWSGPVMYAVNAEHYSRTTTAQQNALRVLLEREGFVRQPGLAIVAYTPYREPTNDGIA